jgi:uroporphyrinogen decarboxylase
MEGERGFIVNLGHGIAPDVPEKAVQALVSQVKEKRR